MKAGSACTTAATVEPSLAGALGTLGVSGLVVTRDAVAALTADPNDQRLAGRDLDRGRSPSTEATSKAVDL